ncbi:MAG: hypothetical protein WB797_17240 [Nocardioides sp.]
MVIEPGDRPTPEVEPAEPRPGGVDAIDGVDPAPVVPDLSPYDHPAVDGAPGELAEPEQTEQGAGSDGASEPEKEAPA